MGSDESHFNVSLIVRDKVTRQCPQTATFEEKGEPKQIRTEVPLLTSLTLTARPDRLTVSYRGIGGFIPGYWGSGGFVPGAGEQEVLYRGIGDLEVSYC